MRDSDVFGRPVRGSPRLFVGGHVHCMVAGAKSICVHSASYPSDVLTPDSVRHLIDASNPDIFYLLFPVLLSFMEI